MQTRTLRLGQAIGALALLLLPSAVLAQPEAPDRDDQLNRPTIERLTSASDLVVVGRVVRNHSRWVGKKIITTSEVQPLETLKGRAPGETLQVSFLGGTVGVIHQTATHFPTLDEGEVAILFLGAPTPETAAAMPGYRVVEEAGKVRLLNPGEPQSRLENNRRLQQFVDEVSSRVRKGGR